MDFNSSIKKIGSIWDSPLRRKEIREAVREKMIPALDHLTREIKAAAPVATGKTRDGIKAEPWASGYGGKVVTESWQAIPIDTGAKPGSHEIEPLVAWVEIKLGLSGEEAVRTANAIGYTHITRGIRPHNFWWGTFERVRGTINSQYLKPIGSSIAKKLNKSGPTKTEKIT